MDKYRCILLGSVCLSGLSQILLKKGALVKGVGRHSIYMNVYTITGYSILLFVTLLNLYIFKYLPMSSIVLFLPLTYIIIAVMSYLVFNEKFSIRKIIASILIVAGIVIYYI